MSYASRGPSSVLKLNLPKVKPLTLNAANTAMLAELAPIVEGKPDVTKISEIDLQDLEKKFRMQRVIFEVAGEVFEQMNPTRAGSKDQLLAQLIRPDRKLPLIRPNSNHT